MFFSTNPENDLEMIQRTTKTIEVAVFDQQGNPYISSPNDLVHFGVKADPSVQRYLIKKTVGIDDGGIAAFTICPEDTQNLPIGNFYYDISLESNGDFYNIIPCSRFTVTPGITRKEGSIGC